MKLIKVMSLRRVEEDRNLNEFSWGQGYIKFEVYPYL